MKKLLLAFCLLLVAMPIFSQSKFNYAKHKAVAATIVEGYTKARTKLVDSTDMSKYSYNIYDKTEKLSNDFETSMMVTFGACRSSQAYKGSLTAYKKTPAYGIIRTPGAREVANTQDSSWVVTTAEGKKVIMNYYYVYMKTDEGTLSAKMFFVAHYDNGYDHVETKIRPSNYITSESGTPKVATEEEFKSKLPTVKELETESLKVIQAFIPQI